MRYIHIATLSLVFSLGMANAGTSEWEGLWAGARAEPELTLRGTTEHLPLYGGIPLYDGMWAGHEPNDHSTANPFHDKEQWRRRFEELQALRLNALIWLHPHPFALFIDYGDAYPEATYLTPTALAAKREMLTWIIAEGKRHGVALYCLTWNIWLPKGFASAHGTEQHSVDTPLTRRFTRWSVRQFFDTYPEFGGLIVIAGETPPGCSDFIRDGVVAGMRDAKAKPTFVYWTWCSYPEQARECLEAYNGPSMVMGYLQYEQFFAHKADPRLRLYSDDLGGRPMLALGGPKSAHGSLLYAHPRMIYDVIHDFQANGNGRGLISECVTAPTDRWLARAAFARYSWDPTEAYDERFWQSQIASRYGSRDIGKAFLALGEPASEIVPTQYKLTHSQSDHFMIQPGLLLAQIVGMPTISTYIFENAQKLNDRGYLAENMGLCRPNPDWDERVLPVTQWALSEIPDEDERDRRMALYLKEQTSFGYQPQPIQGNERTPMQVVEELEKHVAQARRALIELLPLVDGASQRHEELDSILRLAEVNIALGAHLAHKDRAGIAWERYRILGRKADADTCLDEMEKALETWRTYAKAFDAVRPGGDVFWTSGLQTPPPVSQNDLWFSYRLFHGRMNSRTALWEREVDAVRDQLANSTHASIVPPTHAELEPHAAGLTVARLDFEAPDDPRFHLVTETCSSAPTDDPAWVLAGKRSLLADSRMGTGEWHMILTTDPTTVPLKPETRYQVRLKVRSLALSGMPPGSFTMALRSVEGDVSSDVGEGRAWSRPVGSAGERLMTAHTKNYGDYYLFLGLHGPAAMVVDDIEIVEVQTPKPKPGVVASFDFETEDDERWQPVRLTSRVSVTDDPALVIEGKYSLLADTRASEHEWHDYFQTIPEEVKLHPLTRYRVRVRYRSVAPNDREAGCFTLALRSISGGVPSDVGDRRVWVAPGGTIGEHVMVAETLNFDDYFLFCGIHGKAAIVVDRITIEVLP